IVAGMVDRVARSAVVDQAIRRRRQAAKPTRRSKTTATRATLSASIVATIKERVISWQYPPDHRLTEEALCREFNVSRSPVREALRVLATNGFIKRMAH